MDFGIGVASKIDEIGYITHAENLGYSHAWVADSQKLLLLPAFDMQYRMIEDFSRHVMVKL